LPNFSSFAEPTIVGQSKRKTTVETSVVTRRQRALLPGSRNRIVYVIQEREVEVSGALRLAEVVEGQRAVAISGEARTVTIDPISSRVVIITDRGEEM
jgi:hypothetical protein